MIFLTNKYAFNVSLSCDHIAKSFFYSYETSDGTSRQESGKLDNPESENAALTVTGEYAYVAPDGKHYKVTFTAGPNGFQPKTSLAQKK